MKIKVTMILDVRNLTDAELEENKFGPTTTDDQEPSEVVYAINSGITHSLTFVQNELFWAGSNVYAKVEDVLEATTELLEE